MTSIAIRDTSLLLSVGGGHCRQIMTAFGELELAELREAFDEFDKVALSHRVVQVKDQDGN